MGYLDNTSVTVDAVLTNKGRQVLAMGGQLNITKFALADDEVDYGLWNPAHSLGSNYYGAVIENMPVLEASPDETQMLRYKLVTLPKTAIGIPQITIGGGTTQITFTRLTDAAPVTVTTSNYAGGNAVLGYTAILSDNTVASLMVDTEGGAVDQSITGGAQNRMRNNAGATADLTGPTFSDFMSDEVGTITTTGNSVTVTSSGPVGKFILRPMSVIGTKSALLTIIANETGGFRTIVVTATNTVSQDYVDASGTGAQG